MTLRPIATSGGRSGNVARHGVAPRLRRVGAGREEPLDPVGIDVVVLGPDPDEMAAPFGAHQVEDEVDADRRPSLRGEWLGLRRERDVLLQQARSACR